jgi:hypothetical protein
MLISVLLLTTSVHSESLYDEIDARNADKPARKSLYQLIDEEGGNPYADTKQPPITYQGASRDGDKHQPDHVYRVQRYRIIEFTPRSLPHMTCIIIMNKEPMCYEKERGWFK